MFCQVDKYDTRLYNCQTLPTSKKIIELSKHDSVMMYRLGGVHDLPAAEGKYHLNCYRAFERKNSRPDIEDTSVDSVCFDTVMAELKGGLDNDEVYSLDTVWSRYCELLADSADDKMEPTGTYHSQNFKERIRKHLKGTVEFVRPLNPHEPLLVFSALASGAAIQSLNESTSCTEQNKPVLCHSEQETIDIETEILSWLYLCGSKGSW